MKKLVIELISNFYITFKSFFSRSQIFFIHKVFHFWLLTYLFSLKIQMFFKSNLLTSYFSNYLFLNESYSFVFFVMFGVRFGNLEVFLYLLWQSSLLYNPSFPESVKSSSLSSWCVRCGPADAEAISSAAFVCDFRSVMKRVPKKKETPQHGTGVCASLRPPRECHVERWRTSIAWKNDAF